MIAALFVQTDGAYSAVGGVDMWDEGRDARNYDGPYPVIAHPPCQRWGKLWAGQPLWIKKTGQRKKKGDDGGCFASALASVRTWGGVLEHPEHSHAWAHFGLAKPPRSGGWVEAGDGLGHTCCFEQGRYGHYARKPTWLYAVRTELPELDWGKSKRKLDPKMVERLGMERAIRRGEVASSGGGVNSTPRIHTPPQVTDLLVRMARSVK
jgi:hypothetical protein